MSLRMRLLRPKPLALGIAILSLGVLPGFGQAGSGQKTAPLPWMNRSLSADERAALVVREMTLDGWFGYTSPATAWAGLESIWQGHGN
jgi:hypothetical protein